MAETSRQGRVEGSNRTTFSLLLMSLVFLGYVKKMLLLKSLFLGKGEGRLSFEFAFMVEGARLLSTRLSPISRNNSYSL